jgi:hypothetical protein
MGQQRKSGGLADVVTNRARSEHATTMCKAFRPRHGLQHMQLSQLYHQIHVIAAITSAPYRFVGPANARETGEANSIALLRRSGCHQRWPSRMA